MMDEGDFFLASNTDSIVPIATEKFTLSDSGSSSPPPVLSPFVQRLVYIQLAVSALAVILNVLVFLIGWLRIRGSYRHYLSNLALVDLLFATGAIISIIGQHFWILPDLMLALAQMLISVMMPLMTVALVPISIDRYVKVCKRSRFAHCFRIVPLVCVIVDVFPISTYVICKMIFEIPHRWANWIYVVVIPVTSLLIVFVCNMALFRYISRHVQVVANLENRRRLLETRQLARATCIQAITPLCIQLPTFIGVYSMNAADQIRDDPAEYMRDLAHLLFLLMVSNPLVDAIVTIFVVRTYRVCCRNLVLFCLPSKVFAEHRLKRIQTMSIPQYLSKFSISPEDELARELGNNNLRRLETVTDQNASGKRAIMWRRRFPIV